MRGTSVVTDKAAQMRRLRASRGAVTGAVGRRVSQPCGTLAAYRRHLKDGETPCEPCRAANREHSNKYRLPS